MCPGPFTSRLFLVEYAPMLTPHARVAELVDAVDSKSIGREVVRVQVSPWAPFPDHRPWPDDISHWRGHRPLTQSIEASMPSTDTSTRQKTP
jgi:hypothetical protein